MVYPEKGCIHYNKHLAAHPFIILLLFYLHTLHTVQTDWDSLASGEHPCAMGFCNIVGCIHLCHPRRARGPFWRPNANAYIHPYITISSGGGWPEIRKARWRGAKKPSAAARKKQVKKIDRQKLATIMLSIHRWPSPLTHRDVNPMKAEHPSQTCSRAGHRRECSICCVWQYIDNQKKKKTVKDCVLDSLSHSVPRLLHPSTKARSQNLHVRSSCALGR